MCNAAAIIQGVQTGLGIGGGIISAFGNKAEGEYGSQVSERNAQIADRAAADAYSRANEAQGYSRLKWGQLAGAQRSALANSNVDLQSATAMDLLADTAMMSEHDARVLENNAVREAWGYKAQASQYRAQAKMAKLRGTYNMWGSILGAAGGSASGISQTIDLAKKK